MLLLLLLLSSANSALMERSHYRHGLHQLIAIDDKHLLTSSATPDDASLCIHDGVGPATRAGQIPQARYDLDRLPVEHGNIPTPSELQQLVLLRLLQYPYRRPAADDACLVPLCELLLMLLGQYVHNLGSIASGRLHHNLLLHVTTSTDALDTSLGHHDGHNHVATPDRPLHKHRLRIHVLCLWMGLGLELDLLLLHAGDKLCIALPYWLLLLLERSPKHLRSTTSLAQLTLPVACLLHLQDDAGSLRVHLGRRDNVTLVT